jgi:microcystin-dependent protein
MGVNTAGTTDPLIAGTYVAGFNNGYGANPGAGKNVTFPPVDVNKAGGSQPHENRQPFLVINFAMCLSGIFPSRN